VSAAELIEKQHTALGESSGMSPEGSVPGAALDDQAPQTFEFLIPCILNSSRRTLRTEVVEEQHAGDGPAFRNVTRTKGSNFLGDFWF
jgi:hypothetical protein